MNPQKIALKLTPTPIGHPAATAWSKFAGPHSSPSCIEVFAERDRNRGAYRLVNAGPGGISVVAKRCRLEGGQNERLIYQEILPRLPGTALKCYGLVADKAGDYCWLFVEDAGDERYVLNREDHRVLAGRWLGEMHAAAQRLPLEHNLPGREPEDYLEMLTIGRDMIGEKMGHSEFDPADLKVLADVISHLDFLEKQWDRIERFCEDIPRTLVHDDLATKNARVRTGVGLLVMDWESAGWGVPATDLAQDVGESLTPDLREYWSSSKDNGLRMEWKDVVRLADLGRVFRLLNAIAWTNWGFDGSVVSWYIGEMSWYEGALREWVPSLELPGRGGE